MTREVNIAPTSGFDIWHVHCRMRREMLICTARAITRARIALERNIREHYDPTKDVWP